MDSRQNDICDLEFRRCLDSDALWNIAPFMAGDGGCDCLVDSTELVHEKHPLVFRSIEMFLGSLLIIVLVLVCPSNCLFRGIINS